MGGYDFRVVATGNRGACTTEAVNHGSNDAAAVEVTLTGVPEGTGGVAGQGRYAEAACYDGLCEGDSAGYCQETFFCDSGMRTGSSAK